MCFTYPKYLAQLPFFKTLFAEDKPSEFSIRGIIMTLTCVPFLMYVCMYVCMFYMYVCNVYMCSGTSHILTALN